MASALKGTGQKLGGAFVVIRASLGPLREGLAAARSIVRTSVRGISKIAILPITVSLKAIKGAMSAVVGIVKSALRRVRQLMLMAGIGGGAFVWGFARFEKAMKQATAVSETTAEQFKQMSEMARGQAMRLNKSASELAEGFYFLGSAGLKATDQIAAFPAVATLAKAAVIEMGAATEMVVDTMKGFGIAFENTTHVTDVMAKAVTSSNMTFAQLGTALSYVSGVARMANNTLEETTAAIAQMADVGIKGSRAGVYMRTGLLRLMAPQAAARKELEKFGVSIYTAEGKMKPFVQIVGELGEALRGATEEQRNMAFKALFGQRAITGQIAIFRQGREELERFTEMLRNAGGTAEEIARKQLDNLAAQFGRLIKIVMDTAYAIGNALGPALTEAVADLQTQFKKLNEFFKKHELVIAKYALKGYRHFKAFGSGVIDIVKDISQNWDERWAFMVKAVRIQVKAARDIISTTFDDVWATLKDGAIAYGKTLYEVFRKVFTDIARNIGTWMRRAYVENKLFTDQFKEYQKLFTQQYREQYPEAKAIPKDVQKGIDEKARGVAERFLETRRKKMDEMYKPIETESWGDVGEKIKEHWIEPYEDAKERISRAIKTIIEIEKKAAAEIGKAVPEAWKDQWKSFKDELKEIDSDIERWYKKQKKLAGDATTEIEGLAKARKDLDAGLGGKLTAETETKEEKTVSFVGIKEAWQRMVESISSPQTKMLSQQTDLLADIDTGQADIVDAVQDVEAAVRSNFAGGPEPSTAEVTTPGAATDEQVPTRAGTRRERRRSEDEADAARREEILPKRRQAREKRLEKEPPETAIEKKHKRVREEIKERKRGREDVAALEEHKREYPYWKPAELPKPAPVEVEAPEITAPEIGPIQINEPGPLGVEAPQIAPVGVEAPELSPLGVKVPELEPLGVTVPQLGVDMPKVPAPPRMTIPAPEIAAPQRPALHDRAGPEPSVRTTGMDGGGLATLIKEVRNNLDELRRINTNVKKLAPIGAVGP